MSKYKSLMLASAIKDYDKLTFPKFGSPKLDGVRSSIGDGIALSRNFKLIPNLFVQSIIGHEDLNGLDGELIVGEANGKTVFRDTMSGVMRADGQPDFTFWVFDYASPDSAHQPFTGRFFATTALVNGLNEPRIKIVPQLLLNNMKELEAYEAKCLAEGFEGVMLRDPNGIYKYGRSSEKEAILLKVKRFNTDEAVIIGFEERMENQNEKVLSETGKMKRTTHADGKVGRGDMGAILVDWNGKKFSIGSGFDDMTREHVWENQKDFMGQTVTFKHFAIGEYDLPRFPIFVGFRHEIDTPKKEKKA